MWMCVCCSVCGARRVEFACSVHVCELAGVCACARVGVGVVAGVGLGVGSCFCLLFFFFAFLDFCLLGFFLF